MALPELDEILKPYLARRTDPDTSKGLHPARTAQVLRVKIAYLFARHTILTNEQLCDLLPEHPPSSVRTRRREISDLGLLIEIGKRANKIGQPSKIYQRRFEASQIESLVPALIARPPQNRRRTTVWYMTRVEKLRQICATHPNDPIALSCAALFDGE